MKKSLLATAVLAAASGNAFAQSSVTLYGLLDTGVGYSRLKGSYTDAAGQSVGVSDSTVGMTNGVKNGTRWGLRGQEDLGGGLYATFQLESGFNVSNGNNTSASRMFSRETTLGLKSLTWGEVKVGRQYNVGSRMLSDLFGGSFGGGFYQSVTGFGLSAGDFVRYDNLVVYQTPNLSGLTASAGYSFNAEESRSAGTGTADKLRAITAGLNYKNGPLYAFAAYDQLNAPRGSAAGRNGVRPKNYMAGVSYDFSVVKALLAYGRTTDGWFAAQTLPSGFTVGTSNGIGGLAFADGFRSNSYLVGLSAPLGKAGSAFASWQRVDANNTSLTGGDSTMNTYSVGYSYNLSKRTDIYALASYTKNFAFLDDAKLTETSIGLRHRF